MKKEKIITNVKRTVNNAILTSSLALGAIMVPLSTYAAYENVTADTVTSGFIKFITKLGVWAGIPWTAGSIFTLVLSVRNEDAEGRNKAILSLVCAIALLGMGTILGLFGLS